MHSPAKASFRPSPPQPPPFLHTRFARLSSRIHSSLLSIAPASHRYLASDFTSSPPLSLTDASRASGDPSSMTVAEKEMEVIRQRRDALIAKAAQARASQQSSPPRERSRSNEVEMQGSGSSEQPDRPPSSGNLRPSVGRCHGCGVSVTVEWRNGPDGPKSLCNACGVSIMRINCNATGKCMLTVPTSCIISDYRKRSMTPTARRSISQRLS